jgi:hypothetical protein
VCLLNHDGVTAHVISGRYLDRLERRDGKWKIALRPSIVELTFTADASLLHTDIFKVQGIPEALEAAATSRTSGRSRSMQQHRGPRPRPIVKLGHVTLHRY